MHMDSKLQVREKQEKKSFQIANLSVVIDELCGTGHKNVIHKTSNF